MPAPDTAAMKSDAHDAFDAAWVSLKTTVEYEEIDPNTGGSLGKKTEISDNELSETIQQLAHTIIDAAIDAIAKQMSPD